MTAKRSYVTRSGAASAINGAAAHESYVTLARRFRRQALNARRRGQAAIADRLERRAAAVDGAARMEKAA
jgi:hypothetical protein